MNTQYFCLACQGNFITEEACDKHGCNPIFKMKGGTITVELSSSLQMKRTRWGRFMDRLFARDIAYGLAIVGLIVMNGVFLRHFNFTFWESTIEGLGWGLAIPRLIK